MKAEDEKILAAFMIGIQIEKVCKMEKSFITIAASSLPIKEMSNKLYPLARSHFEKTARDIEKINKKVKETVFNNSILNNSALNN